MSLIGAITGAGALLGGAEDPCARTALVFTSEAQAQAFYACKYQAAAEKYADINLAIAGIQQAASAYFADKQHDVAKQNQVRLDEQWKFSKEQGEALFNHWRDNSSLEEIEQLKKASDREEKGYTPDYETAQNRAIADVRGQFGKTRLKLMRERKAHCTGATKYAMRQLDIAEARAAISATNAAYRYEEQRKELKEAQNREELYKWVAVFRGSIGDSLNASKSASAVAAARSQIDPYEGWLHAFGGLSGLGRAIGTSSFIDNYGAMGAAYQSLYHQPIIGFGQPSVTPISAFARPYSF